MGVCRLAIVSKSTRESGLEKQITYGHERIDTIAIPITIANLTRNAMRKATSNPPHMIASHV